MRVPLSSTGEARAPELAARFQIDIRERGFCKRSTDIIEAHIVRYLAL